MNKSAYFVINNKIKVNTRTVKILLPMAIMDCFWLLKTTHNTRYVVLPILVIVTTSIWFFVALWNRDSTLPIFDIGVVCLGATSTYALIPLLGYLLIGGNYTILNSYQLYILCPNAEQIGALAWFYAVYIISFAVIYLIVRGHASVKNTEFRPPNRMTTKILVILFLLLMGFFIWLKIYYGVDFQRSYNPETLYGGELNYLGLPLFSRQIIHNLHSILYIFKFGLMIILMAHWRKKVSRYILLIWFSMEFLRYAFNMGARTYIMLLFMSFFLLYHRLVKHVKPLTLVLTIIIFFSIFLISGWIRSGANLQSNLQNLTLIKENIDISSLSINNEFEALFGGTYDLYYMKKNDLVKDVPWQVYLYELLLLFPQQLLPFKKINPQYWYLTLSSNPSYFMFNPICQALIGLGWLELVFRGALLAWFFAKLHRWYVRYSISFWKTLFYLFMTLWSFYTIRSSTFRFFYRILYHYIPAMLLVYFCGILLNILSINKRKTRTLGLKPDTSRS